MPFDANQRLAQIAVWTDAGAAWIGQEAARADGEAEEVTLTLRRDELERFVSGMRWISRSLLGLAQPIPPLPPACHRPTDGGGARLRLVGGSAA